MKVGDGSLFDQNTQHTILDTSGPFNLISHSLWIASLRSTKLPDFESHRLIEAWRLLGGCALPFGRLVGFESLCVSCRFVRSIRCMSVRSALSTLTAAFREKKTLLVSTHLPHRNYPSCNYPTTARTCERRARGGPVNALKVREVRLVLDQPES
jgi:hypothetical protein